MSEYGLTPADVQKRLGAAEIKGLLTQPNTPPPDQAAIDAVCAEKLVEAEADMHVATGVYYVTPITPREDAPQTEKDALTTSIKGRVLDITTYKLMQLKPAILNAGEKAFYWSQLRKSIDTWLQRVSTSDEDHRLTLPAALERGETVSSTGGAWAESDCNLFSRERMRGWN